MTSRAYYPVWEEDAVFWKDDDEAEEAAQRLHDHLDFQVDAINFASGSDKLKFQCPGQLLRDTVMVAAGSGIDDEKHTLHFTVDARSMVVHTTSRGLKTWVEVRHKKCDSNDARLFYRMSTGVWKRLSDALKHDDRVTFQIELPKNKPTRGVLKVAVKDYYRGRLSTAGDMPATGPRVAEVPPVSFNPKVLGQALRQVASVLRAVRDTDGVVYAADGMVFAGGPKAVITVADPSLARITFEISPRDALPLARILGRMQAGRASFYASEDEYAFSDELVTCSVKRVAGKRPPIEKIIHEEASRRLALLPDDVIRAAFIANIIEPAHISFKWSASFPGRLSIEALSARNARPAGLLTDQLNLESEVERASDLDAKVDFRLWLTSAGCLGWNPSETRWEILGNDRVMRMVAVKDDRVTSVYLPLVH